MGKQLDRKKSRNSRQYGDAEIIEFKGSKFQNDRVLPPIKALNPTQAQYLSALRSNQQIVVLGPAGTGKTWIAATHAADLFRAGKIDKIIITRPNVPCGRSLGFFPGSLQEKFAPWAVPIVDAIKERMGEGPFEIALKRGGIEMAPFEVMRGRSWKNAFILLDEAQNTSVSEIKTFLTRVGENCVSVINGDVNQSDIQQASGLGRMIELIRTHDLPVPVIEFAIEDIVRSGICAMWVKAFEGDVARA